ncbi:MAG: TIR domain-containing protein [Hyphomonas sp.]
MSKVFVSFDWENDRHYKFLLQGWHNHSRFEFTFEDGSAKEIKSEDVSRVRAALTRKINEATYTLVIVGRYANSIHRDHRLIGYRNWINFEVAQSKAANNGIVAVKLDRLYESPEELKSAGAKWAMSFNEQAIVKALGEA